MHGMVNEWVLDQYGDYPAEAVLAPVGVTTNANLRVLRGGLFVPRRYPAGHGQERGFDRIGGWRRILVSGSVYAVPFGQPVGREGRP